MKRKRILLTARRVVVTATMALAAAGLLQASVVSDPVTASEWTLASGANFLSAPAHQVPVFTGTVSSVSGDNVTLNGVLAAGALNKVNLAGSGVYAHQYVLVVRNDVSSEGSGTQGDWFTVESNTASVVTVTPDGYATTASRVAAGNTVEVFKLLSLKDVFGVGGAGKFDLDNNLDDVSGDALYLLDGTSFANTVVYHDGSLLSPAGYYLDFGIYLGDGSQFTFAPDQGVLFFNNYGPAFDATVLGTLQAYNLTHYLASGFNGTATGFAAPSPIGTSKLLESGFAPESNLDDTSDAVFTLAGTSFADTLVYHDGSLLAPAGWRENFGPLNPAYPLNPGVGFFVKTAGTYLWRQPVPFVP